MCLRSCVESGVLVLTLSRSDYMSRPVVITVRKKDPDEILIHLDAIFRVDGSWCGRVYSVEIGQ